MHWMSTLTCLTFTVQTLLSLSVTICVRLSFLGQPTASYQPTIVLLLTELVKLILSLVMTCITNAPLSPPHEKVSTLYYVLPAFLYSISNAIIFVTVGIISPGEFVLLWQSKMAATALLYRFVLKRPVAAMQWLGLAGVLIGVFVIEISIDTDTTTAITATTTTLTTTPPTAATFQRMSRQLAITITLVGATVSSFAGVCLEWVYKKSTENIWRQNTRLYLVELMFYGATLGIQSQSTQHQIDVTSYASIFAGFNSWCVALIFLQSFLGFGIGFVLKYFDVILGLQSAAAATVLNVFVSIAYFDLKASPMFGIGALVVAISIYTYHVNKVHVYVEEKNNDLMATDMNTSSSTENAVVVEIPRSPRNAVHSIGVGRTGRRREQEDTGDLNDNEEKDRLLGDTCSGGVLETRRGTTFKNI